MVPLIVDISVQDLGDLRQLFKAYNSGTPTYKDGGAIEDLLDEALEAVVQELVVWARQHEADGRYKDAEYLFRQTSYDVDTPRSSLCPYQSNDVTHALVSIYEKIGGYPAAEMAQEMLLTRLFFFAKNPKEITKEQTRAVYAYSRMLFHFQKRVLGLRSGLQTPIEGNIDLFIAYRLAVLDIALLNEVSLEQGLITLQFNEDDFCPSLHVAAKANATNLAQLLIEKGADINSRDVQYYTPLHTAAEYGKSAMTELLLVNDADVNATDNMRRTPLHASLYKEPTLEVVAMLINAKADMDSRDKMGTTALTIAVQRDLPAVARFLLEHGADVEGPVLLGERLLLTAVRSKREWAVKLLLENGADLVGRNALGLTALYFAVYEAQESIVQILLNHGVMTGTTVDQQDGDSIPALHCAIGAAYTSIVEMLLKAGADIYKQEYDDDTVLHQAVRGDKKSHEDIVRLLLTHSAPPEAVNNFEETVLHLAVVPRSRNMIPILLQHVEPDKLNTICQMRDHWGQTPLDIARAFAEVGKDFSDERSVLYQLENALGLTHSSI